jgi:hypothetical protein
MHTYQVDCQPLEQCISPASGRAEASAQFRRTQETPSILESLASTADCALPADARETAGRAECAGMLVGLENTFECVHVEYVE